MSKLYVEIEFPIDHPEKHSIKTNIRDGLVRDFLLDPVLRGMAGKGKDTSKPIKRKTYHIRITCDLSYDDVNVSHDCGNAGLMTGIIMDVVNRMPSRED